MQASSDAVAHKVAAVRETIADAARVSGRTGDDVTIVAAVKYVDTEVCRALVAAGVADLGENRGTELERKQAEFAADPTVPAPTWHYIGRVQSRQAPDIAAQVNAIHALCSDSAAQRLARAAREGLTLPQLLVQVNIADDPAKDGLAPGDVERWIDALPPEITIAGLMTMPAFADHAEDSRAAFARLRDLRDALRTTFGDRHSLAALSMGTTQDFDVAIEEGASHVRLGRILYASEE